MIKNIFKSELRYNVLMGIYLVLNSLFIIFLGKKFGIGTDTDIYFISVVVINYIGFFCQMIWESIAVYYVEYKKKGSQHQRLYLILLNISTIFSIIIVFLYFICIKFFTIPFYSSFLNIYIFFIIFQNIIFINKGITNLEHHYAMFYIPDIILYSVLIICLPFINNIDLIAYISLFMGLIVCIFQFYIIFVILNFRYSFLLYSSEIDLRKVIIDSIKLKIASILYSYKDIAIAFVMLSAGHGVYSLFSYINKIIGVIFQITNTPISNVFMTKIAYMLFENNMHYINILLKQTLIKAISVYISLSLIAYFFIDYILYFTLGDAYRVNDVIDVRWLFIIMCITYFFILIFSPYGKIISIFKFFNQNLVLNVAFFFGLYVMKIFLSDDYRVFLYCFLFIHIIYLFWAMIICHTKLLFKDMK